MTSGNLPLPTASLPELDFAAHSHWFYTRKKKWWNGFY